MHALDKTVTAPTLYQRAAWGADDSSAWIVIQEPFSGLALGANSDAAAVIAEIPGVGTQIVSVGRPWIGKTPAVGAVIKPFYSAGVTLAQWASTYYHRLELLAFSEIPPGGMPTARAARITPMTSGTATTSSTTAATIWAGGASSFTMWIANDGGSTITWNARGAIMRGPASNVLIDYAIVTGSSITNGNHGIYHIHTQHADRIYITVTAASIAYRIALEVDDHNV